MPTVSYAGCILNLEIRILQTDYYNADKEKYEVSKKEVLKIMAAL